MPGGDHLFLFEPQLIGEIGSELEGVFRVLGRSQVEDVFGTFFQHFVIVVFISSPIKNQLLGFIRYPCYTSNSIKNKKK